MIAPTHPPVPSPSQDFRTLFIGAETQAPVLGGSQRRYVNLDNAASTPALKAVQRAVGDFLEYYSSVHRGTGFKSQLSTHVYEQARAIVLQFVGGDPRTHTCIFGKNTTEAINKLARRFPFRPGRDMVLTSGMEHHSNDLPWRAATKTVHVGMTGDGRLDEADYEAKLALYGNRLALVTISGASNVTGFINPVHHLAEKAHAVGAQFAVDCAQLAPHRQVEMLPLEDPAHLDYVMLSAHKMYAPFGAGALVGRRDIFESGDPDMTGGGTVEIVTLDDVIWTGPPDREEAGSPNTVGAIAMAAAIRQLQAIGMQTVAEHEARLTTHALEKLPGIPGIRVFGDQYPARSLERLGVIPLQLGGISHFLVAAVLGHEFGIGVRSGCFCAHPYILHLLGLSPQEAQGVRQRMLSGDRSYMPGLIRVSFGLYNTIEDIDALVEALACIARGDYTGRYHQDIASGEYRLEGWEPEFGEYFSWGEGCVQEKVGK
jgi:selenocysteine lyase/cysteine desulfurase